MGVITVHRLTSHMLKRERERLNLTQAGLAIELGVTRNTIARWEMGLYPVPRWACFFLAVILPGILAEKGGQRGPEV